jgi:hypothetical protein
METKKTSFQKNSPYFLDPPTGSYFSLDFVTAMTHEINSGERSKTMKTRVTVEEWVQRFRAIGLDDAAMEKWHRLFELENPEGHQSFLEWLGLPEDRITAIRSKYI